MMTAGGKLLCNCSMPYCMCYSVNKMRKIILFQLTFKPEQWRCRRTHVFMKTRNVSHQFFSTFNIIAIYICVTFWQSNVLLSWAAGYVNVMQGSYHHSETQRVIATSRYRQHLQKYLTSSLGRTTRGGSLEWKLDG